MVATTSQSSKNAAKKSTQNKDKGKQSMPPNKKTEDARNELRGQLKFACSFDGCDRSFTSKDCQLLHESHIHAPRVKCSIEGCEEIVKERSMSAHIRKNHVQTSKCFKCRKVVDKKDFKNHYLACKGKF